MPQGRTLAAILASTIVLFGFSPSAAAQNSGIGKSIVVADIQVTKDNADNILNDENASVSYDIESNTLTLKDATFSNEHIKPGAGRDEVIYCGDEININVIGENKIVNAGGGGKAANVISAESDVNFIGDGTLELTAGANIHNVQALYTTGGLEVDGPTIIANGGVSERYSNHAIEAWKDIVVKNGTVKAKGGEGGIQISSGIATDGAVEILGGTVESYGGDVTGGTRADEETWSSGIDAATITVSNSTLIASGQDYAIGVDDNQLIIDDTANVMVSENADGSSPSEWDRETPLNHSGVPYKYVEISGSDTTPTATSIPPALPTGASSSPAAPPLDQPSESATAEPAVTLED